MRVAAAVRFLLVVLAVTAVAARDLRGGEPTTDLSEWLLALCWPHLEPLILYTGRTLLYGHHCEDCEYHKYCDPRAASAAAAASNGDASAAAAAASSGTIPQPLLQLFSRYRTALRPHRT